jgi:hypothetical protein
MSFLNASIFGNLYGNGDPNPNPNPTPEGGKDGKKDGEGETPRVFTQDEVNAMMAEHKRTLRQELDNLKKQGDPIALQKKVKELQDSLLTKEELARQQSEELKNNFETQIKDLSGKAETWQKRYNETVLQNEIAKGAVKHDAFDPDQLSLIIGPMTRVEEVTNDKGEGTGKFKSVTTIEIDGKKLELSTVDAIGKLRESGKFPNQFRVKGQPGTGLTLNNQPTTPDLSDGEVPKDMGQFMQMYSGLKKKGRI